MHRCSEGTLCVIKQIIFHKNFFACIENSSQCSFYRFLISLHCLQYYLTKPIPFEVINKKSEIMYIYCDINPMEDEFHFTCILFFEWNFFVKIYETLYGRRPSVFKLGQLLNSENVKIMNNLGKYTNNSLKLQNDLLP